MRPFLFLLPLLLCLSAAAATVVTLDGERREGAELALGEGRVTLDGTAVALADIDWFADGAPSGPLDPAADGRLVVFADGGVLPVGAVLAGGDDAVRVQVGPRQVDLALGRIIAWGTVADLAARPTERDQVFLEKGVLAGTVMGIRDGQIRLQTSLRDEAVSLPLASVRSLRLSTAPAAPAGVHLAVDLVQGQRPLLLRPAWPPAPAAVPAAVLAEPGSPLVLGDGRPFVPRYVVRGNRRVYLSDLEPASVEEEGAFGVVWPYARNASIDGSPCFLGGRSHDRCLVVHSRATLTWKLAGRYVRLSALVGIDDAFAEVGDCAVRLLGDGRELWLAKSITGGDPLPVDLRNLDGVDELTLVVDYGARHDIGDHLVLADAWLVRKGGGP